MQRSIKTCCSLCLILQPESKCALKKTRAPVFFILKYTKE